MPPPAPRAAAAEATAVFEGRTFGVHREGNKVRFAFEVSRVFKGELGPSVDVYSPASSATCGRGFEAGVQYVVYARVSPAGVLSDSMCSRTRPSRSAAEDFAELGAGTPPPRPQTTPTSARSSVEPPRIEPEPPPAPPSRRGCTIGSPADLSPLALLAPLALLLAPLLWQRRRRPHAPSESTS